MTMQSVMINNLLFCKNKSTLDGQLPIRSLARLQDWLTSLAGSAAQEVSDYGSLSYQLKGNVDGAGQSILTLIIDVEANGVCQRCLGELAVVRNLEFTYIISLLTESEILLLDDEQFDEVDLIAADKEMDVLSVIEDEVIAAISFSPTHEIDCAPAATEAGEKISPFAALKGFVKG